MVRQTGRPFGDSARLVFLAVQRFSVIGSFVLSWKAAPAIEGTDRGAPEGFLNSG